MGLQEAIQNIWSSDYVQKNPNKAYKVSYQAEYTAVAAYLNGGVEPNWSGYSKLGKGLCEAEKERRSVPAPTPGPLPEPPPFDPNAMCLPKAQKDFGVPVGGADAAPRFQSMLDQLGNGAAVGIEAGQYYFGSTVHLQSRAAMRIVGLGGQNKNDGGYWNTARFLPMRTNLTMFDDIQSGVKHVGTTFEWCNIVSTLSGCRGWHFHNVNSWRLDFCSVQGQMQNSGVFVGHTTVPAEDNAYWEIHEFNASLDAGNPIYIHQGGGKVTGGFFASKSNNSPIVLRGSHVYCLAGQSNYNGPLFRITGAWNTVEWMIEQYGSDTNHVYALEVLRDPAMTEVPWSGQSNYIQSNFTDHPYGSGLMVHLGPNTEGNTVDSKFIGGQVKVLDEGHNNTVR